jgi:predicted transcriptional regulator
MAIELVLASIESVLTGVRAMLAKELVGRDLTQREVAQVLGITPAAVTLYTRGRRGKELADRIKSLKESSLIAKELADQIAERKRRGEDIDEFPLILDAAYRIMRLVSQEPRKVAKLKRRDDRLVDLLRARIEQEQLAAQRNMTLAVATKDEITRILFRQIAIDSMRHADTIGAVLSYLEKPTQRRPAKDEVTQIEAMIREEESATEQPIEISGADPAVKLLLTSVAMDEQKHSALLKGLLKVDRSSMSRRKSS